MIAMKHQMDATRRPYDYRVAYFQRTSAGADTARFSLPSIIGMNPAVSDVDDVKRALAASDWVYSVTCGFAPGSATSGDRHMFGSPGLIAFYVISGRWRPGGVMTWPPQIPTDAIPLTTGIAVRLDFGPSGYTARSSAVGEHVQAYNQNPPSVTAPLPVLHGEDPVTSYVANGCRFFCCTLRNDHPAYGFNADYIPVMKDGAPYIYDRVSGAFYPNIGGAQFSAGPKVADNWDPLDWEEPS